MKIHEYQAKQIFKQYGMPVTEGEVATTTEEAMKIAEKIGYPVVIKSQVHVGGRGKAGGIKVAKNKEDLKEKANKILGMDIKGLTVKKVLIDPAIDIDTEAYLGIILDRKTQKPVMMVSAEGGIDIEEVAAKTPEKIHKLYVNPVYGLLNHQAMELAFKIYSDKPNVAVMAAKTLKSLYNAFIGVDASLAEVNPFVTTKDGKALAIDAKINIDDNGLYRHKEIEAMRDLDAEVLDEIEARKSGLSYIKLDGNIGCLVNGAGLAMATMDLVKYYGGEPANFLDIGGSSNPDKVITALKIITKDPNVKAILFNIFGGITRCDDVANGLIKALAVIDLKIPLVIRLSGTNSEEAKKILADAGLSSADSMDEVVKQAIELSKK